MSHWGESIYYIFFSPNKECIISHLFVHCLGEWRSTYLLSLCPCVVPNLWCSAGIGEASEPWLANELLQHKLNKQEAMNLE